MDRLYYESVTTPPNTPQATPLATKWILEEAHLEYIDIIAPDGPGGTTGIRVLWAQQQIIPWGNLSYLTPNAETIHIGVDEDITISGLVIQTFNTDLWEHTLYLRALIKDISTKQLAAVSALSSSVTVPGTQAGDDTDSSVDTLTAGFDDSDSGDSDGLDDSGSADIGDDDIGDDDTGANPVDALASETSELPAEVATLTLPTTVTLTGTPVVVTVPKAPVIKPKPVLKVHKPTHPKPKKK